MYELSYSRKFKTSFKRLRTSRLFKKGAREGFKKLLDLLRDAKPLPAGNRDHALSGEYAGYRECHIQSTGKLSENIREFSIFSASLNPRLGMWADLRECGQHGQSRSVLDGARTERRARRLAGAACVSARVSRRKERNRPKRLIA